MGKPAARMGDLTAHGGTITLGSTGVMIGKQPSARVSDMAVCVGPPSMNAMGCFTVLIGEAGSGSQAGSA